jgi:peptidoglycan/LPS O-acetylase OafA/YrhL
LNLRNAQRRRITRFIFYLVGAFGTAAMLLQLYNISSLAAFWPFFAGIVYQLVTALAQFARMILLLPD